MRVALQAVAVCGPGLPDWATARAVLAGEAACVAQPIVIPPPARLPSTERRRVGASVKLALAVAEQLFTDDPARGAGAATVFASSGGDGDNCHLLCEALCEPEPPVSPTRFTNSVHNAPSGYWGIAAGARGPSTSLSMHDASFGAGLIEAALQAVVELRTVALVAYDAPYPFPLAERRPIAGPFAVALRLAPPDAGAAIATLSFDGWRRGDADRLDDPGLESLRTGVPAARALTLLAALARRPAGGRATVHVGGLGGEVLPVEVTD